METKCCEKCNETGCKYLLCGCNCHQPEKECGHPIEGNGTGCSKCKIKFGVARVATQSIIPLEKEYKDPKNIKQGLLATNLRIEKGRIVADAITPEKEKSEGLYCEFCGKKHTGQCQKVKDNPEPPKEPAEELETRLKETIKEGCTEKCILNFIKQELASQRVKDREMLREKIIPKGIAQGYKPRKAKNMQELEFERYGYNQAISDVLGVIEE